MCTCGMNNVCDKLLCLGVICQDMLISFALMLVSIDSVEDGHSFQGWKLKPKQKCFFPVVVCATGCKKTFSYRSLWESSHDLRKSAMMSLWAKSLVSGQIK